ncbi:MAG: hypothetical protein M0Q45_04025 [Bacteroidales bacterium]|nr:hypothetical protein [Bacteroidales bacterium]
MIRTLFCSLLIFIVLNLSSQESKENKSLYSGAMLFFQPGFLTAENNYQEINSYSSGIGGILRLYAGNHFTYGLHGGNNKAVYKSANSENSYISFGYGGAFVGFTARKDKLRFCSSLGLGLGKIRNLHIENQTETVLNLAEIYFYRGFSLNPLISLDYYLTEKIALTTQLMTIIAFYNKNDLYFCPTFQIGILFNR